MPDVEVRITGDASGLQAATDEAGGALEGISGQAAGLGGKLGGVTSGLGGMAGGLGSVAAAAGPVGIAIGAAVVGLTALGMAAAQDAEEQSRLESAIVASGAAVGDWQAVLDQTIAKGQELAFTDSAIRDSMQQLVLATGSVTEAQQLNQVAMDLSRLTGRDLESTSLALARAHEGQTGALRKMLPAIDAGATGLEAIAQASQLATGQAERFGDSTVGKAQASSIALSELGETVGSAVLPALDAIMEGLAPILLALADLIKMIVPILVPAFKALGLVIGVVAKGIAAMIGAVKDALDFLSRLIHMILDAVANIGHFLDSINPLKNFQLPDVFGAISDLNPFAVGATTTTNVYISTGADPAQVQGLVRTWADSRGGRVLGLD